MRPVSPRKPSPGRVESRKAPTITADSSSHRSQGDQRRSIGMIIATDSSGYSLRGLFEVRRPCEELQHSILGASKVPIGRISLLREDCFKHGEHRKQLLLRKQAKPLLLERRSGE